MSTIIQRSTCRERAAFGLIDDIGGIVTVLLAIFGIAGLYAPILAAIATILFGVALLAQGRTLFAHYTQASVEVIAKTPVSDPAAYAPIAVILLSAAGAALGVLALLDVNSAVLTPIASIIFGAALVLSSVSAWRLNAISRASAKGQASLRDMLEYQMAFDSLGVQTFAGLAAIIFGILGASGATYDLTFNLMALLILGSALILKGGSLNAILLSFMRAV
ncbi:MAG: hypothetical protein FJX16_02325 [Alphaproteobacteria bacterium]|nr:hypothetical protein [Alphaproteobacteria bacterium]MBM3624154.1 hypothetical protein [Alphaproteobacteria bacterium]